MTETISHDKAIELIPWFINGTLPGTERVLVERHVRQCLPCRSALQEQQQLATLVREQPTIPLAADQGFERLMARVDDEVAHSERRQAAGIPSWSSLSNRWALAAAVLVAVLGATTWILTLDPGASGEQEFVTLTQNSTDETIRLDIIFADNVTETTMRALVRDLAATIVAGPSAAGRYTLRLDTTAIDTSELNAIIDRLNHDDRVRFAGRSFIEVESE